jgi:hypothetical protein
MLTRRSAEISAVCTYDLHDATNSIVYDSVCISFALKIDAVELRVTYYHYQLSSSCCSFHYRNSKCVLSIYL